LRSTARQRTRKPLFCSQASHALLPPGLYEGFGLTPFETAFLDIPSVCSDRPAMNEFLAGCVEHAESGDVQAWLGIITEPI